MYGSTYTYAGALGYEKLKSNPGVEIDVCQGTVTERTLLFKVNVLALVA